MTETITWPAVAAKLIDNLPMIIAALASMLAYLQSYRNGVTQRHSTAAAVTAAESAQAAAVLVATRADTQDATLHQIKEATNGGVQLLRDKVAALENLVRQLVASQSAGMSQ